MSTTQRRGPKVENPTPVETSAAPVAAAAVTEKPPKVKKEKKEYAAPEGGFKTADEVEASDFSTSKFKKLTRKHFSAEYVYMEYMAGMLEKKAARYRADAADTKLLGDSKSAAKAKKLLKLTRELAELKKAISDDPDSGINVDELLASLSKKG